MLPLAAACATVVLRAEPPGCGLAPAGDRRWSRVVLLSPAEAAPRWSRQSPSPARPRSWRSLPSSRAVDWLPSPARVQARRRAREPDPAAEQAPALRDLAGRRLPPPAARLRARLRPDRARDRRCGGRALVGLDAAAAGRCCSTPDRRGRRLAPRRVSARRGSAARRSRWPPRRSWPRPSPGAAQASRRSGRSRRAWPPSRSRAACSGRTRCSTTTSGSRRAGSCTSSR